MPTLTPWQRAKRFATTSLLWSVRLTVAALTLSGMSGAILLVLFITFPLLPFAFFAFAMLGVGVPRAPRDGRRYEPGAAALPASSPPSTESSMPVT